MKNRIILILAILNVIFFVSTLKSCSNTFLQKASRDREMGLRLDLEEKVNKISQEKTILQESLRTRESELEEEKIGGQAIKKALVQEQLVNQSLKDEIQKISKLRETLEEDLKEALNVHKAEKSKK